MPIARIRTIIVYKVLTFSNWTILQYIDVCTYVVCRERERELTVGDNAGKKLEIIVLVRASLLPPNFTFTDEKESGV